MTVGAATFQPQAQRAASAPWRAVLMAGALIGVLDLINACLFWYLRAGAPPLHVLQLIAAGLLGPSSYDGGLATGALGLFLHFFIATSIAGVYALASRKLPVLLDHVLVCGVVYGLCAFLFMSFVVLPLSALGMPRYTQAGVVDGVLIHGLAIGPVSAFFAWIGAGRASECREGRR